MVMNFYFFRVASVKGSLPLPHTVLEHGELAPPRVKEYEDLTEHVFDMLDRIGPKISHDPLAMAKIVRIGRMFFYEVKTKLINIILNFNFLRFRILFR